MLKSLGLFGSVLAVALIFGGVSAEAARRASRETTAEARDQSALTMPEPASLLLFGSGLSLAAARMRRRFRAR